MISKDGTIPLENAKTTARKEALRVVDLLLFLNYELLCLLPLCFMLSLSLPTDTGVPNLDPRKVLRLDRWTTSILKWPYS